MTEFDRVSVTQFGDEFSLDLPAGEFSPFRVDDFEIRVYREPPHVEEINLKSGITQIYTPTEEARQFVFGNNFFSKILYFVDPRFDQNITVVYSSSSIPED